MNAMYVRIHRIHQTFVRNCRDVWPTLRRTWAQMSDSLDLGPGMIGAHSINIYKPLMGTGQNLHMYMYLDLL